MPSSLTFDSPTKQRQLSHLIVLLLLAGIYRISALRLSNFIVRNTDKHSGFEYHGRGHLLT
jgi:hypothetical protein